MSLAPADIAKRAAAARALEMVDDGMTLGLGTGSTAGWFVRLLSERIRSPGLDVVGVATSSATVWLAEELGVPVGVAVTDVRDGGPAAAAGLKAATGSATVDGQSFPTGGDVITEVDGQAITTGAELQNAVDAVTARTDEEPDAPRRVRITPADVSPACVRGRAGPPAPALR